MTETTRSKPDRKRRVVSVTFVVIFITLPIRSRACVRPLWRAKHAGSEQDKPKEVQHG
jgi:hypothetical protein